MYNSYTYYYTIVCYRKDLFMAGRKPTNDNALIHLQLPEELKKEVRLIAADNYTSITSICTRAISDYVTKYKKESKKHQDN